MVFLPPALEPVNWNQLGLPVTGSDMPLQLLCKLCEVSDFGKFDGHNESKYTVAAGKWRRPTIAASPFVQIHGLSPALKYGQQVCKGLKARRGPKRDINLFRLNSRTARMNNFAAHVSIPKVPDEHCMKCVKLAVAHNGGRVAPHGSEAPLYIRPPVFGSCGRPGLTAPMKIRSPSSPSLETLIMASSRFSLVWLRISAALLLAALVT